jgi:hypothetical protein
MTFEQAQEITQLINWHAGRVEPEAGRAVRRII